MDTGASVSVISVNFKTKLGRKVMFRQNDGSSFHAVIGKLLRPLGVCTANVYFSDNVYKAEFIVLTKFTHNVILGLDFLQQCVAALECGTDELFVSPLAGQPTTCSHSLAVCEDSVLPPRSLSSVQVISVANADNDAFDAIVDPMP